MPQQPGIGLTLTPEWCVQTNVRQNERMKTKESDEQSLVDLKCPGENGGKIELCGE
jgi:hypothetical protein